MSSMGKNVSTEPAPPMTPFTTSPVSQWGACGEGALDQAREEPQQPLKPVLHRENLPGT